MSQKKRILSGMRPTGPLHLGNLLGALSNWVNMQDDYECYFFIADWHALTSDYDNTEPIEENRKEIMLDWLSAGLTPEKSTLFVQSQVKEHAELFLLLTMITPVPWLERNPTYKEQIGELTNKDLSTFGFLG
jgi:tryptophanyl-tRNA synthetase